MDYFEFQNGLLHCESTDVRTLAEDFGTPLYV
jgi:diaminopimelate decarboxylase